MTLLQISSTALQMHYCSLIASIPYLHEDNEAHQRGHVGEAVRREHRLVIREEREGHDHREHRERVRREHAISVRKSPMSELMREHSQNFAF